jgi:hypothetical protein
MVDVSDKANEFIPTYRTDLRENEQVECGECLSTMKGGTFRCRNGLLCGKLGMKNAWDKMAGQFGPGLEQSGHGDQCGKYSFVKGGKVNQLHKAKGK